MPTLIPGCDLSTETVVELINKGRTSAINRGARPERTTQQLLSLYVGDFATFYKSARDDFTGRKSRRHIPRAIRESKDPALDQCALIQLMIVALASEIHIIKLLQQRTSERDFIQRELIEATSNFPKNLIKAEGSSIEDYLERRQGLPSIKTLYWRALEHDLPNVINRNIGAAQFGPAHMSIDIPTVRGALVSFTYSPADLPFEYKPGNPMQQQHSMASRPEQSLPRNQQRQMQQ